MCVHADIQRFHISSVHWIVPLDRTVHPNPVNVSGGIRQSCHRIKTREDCGISDVAGCYLFSEETMLSDYHSHINNLNNTVQKSLTHHFSVPERVTSTSD